MTTGKINGFWALIAVILLLLIVAGGVVAYLRYSPGQPVEISIPTVPELKGTVYIEGAVSAPGSYPFSPVDSVSTLLQAAGGAAPGADLSKLTLHISSEGQGPEPQKVDINRAEVWLLEALPGIGQTLAQRIVDYRQKNGPFHNASELLRVAGLGTDTYQQIKDKITVADND